MYPSKSGTLAGDIFHREETLRKQTVRSSGKKERFGSQREGWLNTKLILSRTHEPEC